MKYEVGEFLIYTRLNYLVKIIKIQYNDVIDLYLITVEYIRGFKKKNESIKGERTFFVASPNTVNDNFVKVNNQKTAKVLFGV